MSKIELVNVTKKYKNEVFAIKNISFTANDGEFIVLVGPSGCGKTTILRMLAGLEDITSGEIFFDGKCINNVEAKDRDIGMVFQEYALYPHLNVFENIAFALRVKKEDKNIIKKKVQEIAEITQLTDYLKRKPSELSGGQRQRVALARAIIRKPRLFLFDEPLSNLDAKLRVQMRYDITKLQKELGVTAIYVTHDQTEAMTMGNKIAILNNGTLQQFDTPFEIYTNPTNTFVADFIGLPPINFFYGIVSNNVFTEKDSIIDFSVPLELPDDEYILGIRPENLQLNNLHDINSSQKTVKLSIPINYIEYLGNETILYFQSNNKQNQQKIKINNFVKNITINQKLDVYFNYNNLIIFNKNGERINF